MFFSLNSTLQKFKGDDGLQRLFSAGKLSLYSLMGDFQQTKDELFERRTSCVLNTRRCLRQLDEQFDGIVRTTDKLVTQISGVFATLESFHHHCDLELEYETETYQEDTQQFDRCFASVKEAERKMRQAMGEFSSANMTCKSLNAGAVTQLEGVDAASITEVGRAQMELDLHRRKVQVLEADMAKLQSRQGMVNEGDFVAAQMGLQRETDELQVVGDSYVETLRRAMQSTSFALEQTSMTGWSCCNVFFVQLSTMLNELRDNTAGAASIFSTIKNSQNVSKRITQEKRSLHEARQQTCSDGMQGAGQPAPEILAPAPQAMAMPQVVTAPANPPPAPPPPSHQQFVLDDLFT